MTHSKDITNQRFGRWIALKELKHLEKKGSKYWLCRCDCGLEKPVNKYHLFSQTSKGCIKCSNPAEDLTGKKFGKLTVLRRTEHKDNKNIYWDCQCECERILKIPTSALNSGKRKNCRGCTYEDLTGQRFGNQIVVRRDYASRKWLTKCDCGFEKWKTANTVKQTSSCGRCETFRNIGKTFGYLRILEYAGLNKKKNCLVRAICKCGTTKTYTASNIIHKRQISCGCSRYEELLKTGHEIIGKKFGLITIKKVIGTENGTHRLLYAAKCKCGREIIIPRRRLGSSMSCGCLCGKKIQGENHHSSKFKNEDIKSIRELLKTKVYSQKEISKMYGVSESVIGRIKNRESYDSVE